MKCKTCNGLGLKPFRPYAAFPKALYTEDECPDCGGRGITGSTGREYTVLFGIDQFQEAITVVAETAGQALQKAAPAIGPVVETLMRPGDLLIVEVVEQ